MQKKDFVLKCCHCGKIIGYLIGSCNIEASGDFVNKVYYKDKRWGGAIVCEDCRDRRVEWD